MKKPILLLLFFPLFLFSQNHDADVIIYGGTSSGIAAAIESSRLGNEVILIEPTSRVGGLTTGGLGQTDIGNKQVIGGIALEFYQNIKNIMRTPIIGFGKKRMNTKTEAKPDHQLQKMQCGLLNHRQLYSYSIKC